MKKYKLVQEYPGSPHLGTIIKNNDKCFKGHFYMENGVHLGTIEPWNYPEFWEKIEEEYEILTITPDINNIAYKPFQHIEEYKGALDGVTERYWQIHSIKRLSDSEIFTLGDKVEDHSKAISKISLDDEKYTRMIPWLETGNKYNGITLRHAKKVKRLFTTKDGVDIYEGMGCWEVLNHDLSIHEVDSSSLHILREGLDYKDRKAFSTKEAAEEYILFNKPLLTLQDLIDECLYSGDIEHFKELVKSRL